MRIDKRFADQRHMTLDDAEQSSSSVHFQIVRFSRRRAFCPIKRCHQF
jgi:hypothetical protein